ncbi:MAG: sensor signal transduction histidine kinase [Segetibacter sp.]|nr:sensor signal transduction histidine kinase [Segetibacter sp.]
MGELIRQFDWRLTTMRPPENWPQSLRTSVNIMLNSRFPMFIWWGSDMNMLYNDGYRAIIGDKHPKSLAQPGKVIWSEIWDEIGPLSDSVMIEGKSTWAEDQLLYINRRGYTEESYFTFSYSPIQTELGTIGGVFCAVTETTEKVLAAKRLAKSESNLRNMIMQSPVAMCILKGPQFVVEISNEKMIEIFGRTEADVMATPLFEGLPEAKEQGLEALLHKAYSTGERFVANERLINLPRNGKVQPTFINFVYEPLKELDSTISGIMAVAIDVTEQVYARQRIEEVVTERTRELGEANKKLQQNNNELKQFAYIASHDLQEPVRKVLTYAEMLEKSVGQVDDKSQKYLNKISSSSRRMLALIRDVLTFSQLSHEREEFHQVDLMSLLESIKSDFELLIEEKNASIICTSLPVISAIPLQMSQLFSNLLSNALKFTRKEVVPEIRISSSLLSKEEAKKYLQLNPSVSYYNIEFTDNGIGFNQQNAQQIFDIFQRLHSQSEYHGTGIGLAICKKIALNHKGNISAKSSLNSGATFNIFLPVEQPSRVS